MHAEGRYIFGVAQLLRLRIASNAHGVHVIVMCRHRIHGVLLLLFSVHSVHSQSVTDLT